MKQTLRVLAVASHGGHWEQLMRLSPLLETFDVQYLSTSRDVRYSIPHGRFHHVLDANFNRKVRLLIMLFQIVLVVVKLRPDVVVTTGAAPGYFALMLGRMFKARTIWIDSIANSDELSLAGRKAERFADVWLTQWEHLAVEGGPTYIGAIL